MEWPPVYHVKGWGKFNRYYGDFCTGADTAAQKQAAQQPNEPKATAQASQPTAAPQDTVTVSTTAQTVAQTTSTQVQLLSSQGESVAEIAQQLGLTTQEVENYLG